MLASVDSMGPMIANMQGDPEAKSKALSDMGQVVVNSVTALAPDPNDFG